MPLTHARGRGALALDDVVDLANLRLAGVFEGNIGEERHYALPERLELFTGIPDLIHEELPVRKEGDVRIKTCGRKGTGFAETPNDLVVLLCGRRRHGRVTNKDAHDRSSFPWGTILCTPDQKHVRRRHRRDAAVKDPPDRLLSTSRLGGSSRGRPGCDAAAGVR